ncbi:MAG TPA: hypothetical protein VG734_09855, partial [Lacunisphaera sp.]|nr:hypothetical protein [Lacunisphaera sp.]
MSTPTLGLTSGPALSRFAKHIDAVVPSSPLLYGTHTCDVYSARPALEQRELRPFHCSKFVEELLYVFYGKAAYRPRTAQDGNRFIQNYPVCFLIKLDDSIPLKRVYPFAGMGSAALCRRDQDTPASQNPSEGESVRSRVERIFCGATAPQTTPPR